MTTPEQDIKNSVLEEAAKALDIARCAIDADACPNEFNIIQSAFKRIRSLKSSPCAGTGVEVLLKRLRAHEAVQLCRESADEIERLLAMVEALEQALASVEKIEVEP